MDKYICKICKIIINDNNYNYNEKTFIHKNSKDSIIQCPFCGVNSKYIYNIKEDYMGILNKGNIYLDEKTKLILDHAMKLEVFNGDFYKKASNLVSSMELKEMFYQLSSVELMHAKIHKNLIGEKYLPKLKDMDYRKYKKDISFVEMANERERHAVKYYEKYYNDICDDKIKEIFIVLSNVEKEHIELTINAM
ncbi:ferritin-like domain-containing protein [Clostridium rectalis]|uniref:ferritin-like domain-containing protein n=1 Tax=Clostridium rectalis TaxID=2040295 RepID=UPI000F63B59B|nr:ferritin family protein [Clostridium rectalis]